MADGVAATLIDTTSAAHRTVFRRVDLDHATVSNIAYMKMQ